MRNITFNIILILNLNKFNIVNSQVNKTDSLNIEFNNLDIYSSKQNKNKTEKEVYRLNFMKDSFILYYWNIKSYSKSMIFPISDTVKIKSFIKLKNIILSDSNSQKFNLHSNFTIDVDLKSLGKNKYVISTYGYFNNKWRDIGYRNMKSQNKNENCIYLFGYLKCLRINSLIKKSLKEGSSLLNIN